MFIFNFSPFLFSKFSFFLTRKFEILLGRRFSRVGKFSSITKNPDSSHSRRIFSLVNFRFPLDEHRLSPRYFTRTKGRKVRVQKAISVRFSRMETIERVSWLHASHESARFLFDTLGAANRRDRGISKALCRSSAASGDKRNRYPWKRERERKKER